MDAHEFLITALEGMKDDESVTEWQVRQLAIEQYPRLITDEDLETIDGWFSTSDDNEGD